MSARSTSRRCSAERPDADLQVEQGFQRDDAEPALLDRHARRRGKDDVLRLAVARKVPGGDHIDPDAGFRRP